MRKGGQTQRRGEEREPHCRRMEIFLLPGGKTTGFVGSRKRARKTGSLELQGSERRKMHKRGGSIRAGPRAQEEGQPSPVLFSISKQRWRRAQSLAGFAARRTLLGTAGPFRARPTASAHLSPGYTTLCSRGQSGSRGPRSGRC